MNARIVASLALLLSACAGAPVPEVSPDPAPSPASAGSPEDLHDRGEAAGVHNLAEVTPGLFRGASPEGDGGFALLASLGVKTILTVDGARPDVEAAAKHGIRYVHIPVEYSGLTREEQVKIAKAAVEIPGPMFVHCHHGKHRGPAACGIAWMARTGASPAEVIADMKAAGADPKYAGLYADVGSFVPVTEAERASFTDADIGPVAKTPDLVEAMVQVDGTFDRMKAVRKAVWKVPAHMPDVQPSHEARILAERFREMARMEDKRIRAEDFRAWLAESEAAAWDLEKAITAGDGAEAGKAMDRVNTACNACHDVYRNTKRK